MNLSRALTADWLKTDEENRLDNLWRLADEVRKEYVGDQVHLRGLIEISNYCIRGCGYCGLRHGRKSLVRYRMSREEILGCAEKAVEYGYGTVVIQAGEDYGITRDWLSEIISEIKTNTDLAVTLSMGERPVEDIKAWRNAGADRYLLRFETSDESLYRDIHPSLPKDRMGRIELLKVIKELGYEAGSGIMAGIPGQTIESVADDIELFRKLDLDMVGVGPYIVHQDTPLSSKSGTGENQVSNSELMIYKIIALTRLVCPEANIPATTALATLNKASGRESGLNRGANVVMPNLTPLRYRKLYEIYPAKVCIYENSDDCQFCIKNRIMSINRRMGQGKGNRIRRNERTLV